MTEIRLPSADCTSRCEGNHEFHFDPPHEEVEPYPYTQLPNGRALWWMAGETLEPPMDPLGDIPVAPRREA